MEAELSQQVHKQILRAFRYRSRKGYCWLWAKFGSTRLNETSDDVGKQMLQCLEAKELGTTCPVHSRVHEGRKKAL